LYKNFLVVGIVIAEPHHFVSADVIVEVLVLTALKKLPVQEYR
jgi:hypothetical protein